jgi:hypothetical protein
VTPRPVSLRFRRRLVRSGAVTNAKPSPCGRVESCTQFSDLGDINCPTRQQPSWVAQAAQLSGGGAANAAETLERRRPHRQFLRGSKCGVSWNRSSCPVPQISTMTKGASILEKSSAPGTLSTTQRTSENYAGEVGGLCQAALRWARAGAGLSRPLHSSRR